jgi:delta 1-pyrroline-5-carboxylate dehydrogenase
MSQAHFDIDEVLEQFHTWLEAQSKESLADYADRLTDQVPESTPLGTVLCLANNQDSLLAQTLAALTAGNGVLWPRAQPDDPVQTQALRVGLPLPIKSQITLTDWHPSTDAVPDPLPQAVLYTGDTETLAQLQQQAGHWPNHPVTIISCQEDIDDDFEIPLAQLQH